MALNAAGLQALLDTGNEAVMYAAIGSGPAAANQTSNARVLMTLGAPAGGVITVSNVPMNFTGAPAAAATHLLLFSAAVAGTFYGFQALTGDQAFNANGDYQVTSTTVTATGV